QALVLRKECIHIAGMFTETKSFSDVEFIIGLSLHFKCVILDEPLVYRRLHNENDHAAYWEERCVEGIEMMYSYKDLLPKKIFQDSLYKTYIRFGEKAIGHKKK